MVKVKKVHPPKIEVKDLKEGTLYQNVGLDIVKIENINYEKELVTVRNITLACRQWIIFKNMYIIRKI